MFDFFKKNKEEVVPESSAVKEKRYYGHAAAPGTKICYNPNLIPKLEGDHQTLFGIYGEIKEASDLANYSLVKDKLKEFKQGFLDHILIENVSLYVYMKNALHDDEESVDLVQEFRSEMNEIGKVVRAFILKYETIGVNQDLASSFAQDLAGIGQALVDRIEREEGTLYPLYETLEKSV